MDSEMDNTALKQLVKLVVLNAKETASLLNDGNPVTVSGTQPGSLDRANALRGQAKALLKSFESLS
jgi:hypothetical protein